MLDVDDASLRQPDFSTPAPNRTLTMPESRNHDPSRLLESIDFDGPSSVSFGSRRKRRIRYFRLEHRLKRDKSSSRRLLRVERWRYPKIENLIRTHSTCEEGRRRHFRLECRPNNDRW